MTNPTRLFMTTTSLFCLMLASNQVNASDELVNSAAFPAYQSGYSPTTLGTDTTNATLPTIISNTEQSTQKSSPQIIKKIATVAPEPIKYNQVHTVNVNLERLQQILPLYEDAMIHPWPTIPESNVLLQLNSTNHTVLLLRERLKRTHDLAENSVDTNVFDEELEDAVKIFQDRHGLTADGVVGENTIEQLNVSPEDRVKEIRLNMQRWANLSNQLGSRYILVNIPEYKLHVVNDEKEVLAMKVIVGKTTRQTPEITSRITRIVINPTWNVPNMIAQNDIVPKVIANHRFLNDNSIRIFNNQEEGNHEIRPSQVNWESAENNGFPYHFRQDPGAKNALGLVKFEFQNSHSIYLHDTPVKELFNQDKRDFSSGCVRLEDPFDLVSYLIENDQKINEEKIQTTLEGKQTTYLKLQQPIPIIIAYLTSWVDEKGLVHFANDIYDKDSDTSISSNPKNSI